VGMMKMSTEIVLWALCPRLRVIQRFCKLRDYLRDGRLRVRCPRTGRPQSIRWRPCAMNKNDHR
jgi:hypothetical protein